MTPNRPESSVADLPCMPVRALGTEGFRFSRAGSGRTFPIPRRGYGGTLPGFPESVHPLRGHFPVAEGG